MVNQLLKVEVLKKVSKECQAFLYN